MQYEARAKYDSVIQSECTCVVYLNMRLQTLSEPSFRVGAYLRENCLLSHNAAAKLEEEAERTAEGREGGEGLSLSLSEIQGVPRLLPQL